MIHVCSLAALPDTVKATGASHVLTVMANVAQVQRPESVLEANHLKVQMDDITEAIDGFVAPRPPSGAAAHNPNVGWLFRDPVAAAKEYYQRTKIFPIMHLVGIRRTLVDQHPWLPMAVLKGFEEAKAKALDLLFDTSATKVTMPGAPNAANRPSRIPTAFRAMSTGALRPQHGDLQISSRRASASFAPPGCRCANPIPTRSRRRPRLRGVPADARPG